MVKNEAGGEPHRLPQRVSTFGDVCARYQKLEQLLMEGAAFRAEGFGGRKGAGKDGGERKGQRQHGHAQLLVCSFHSGARRGRVRGLG